MSCIRTGLLALAIVTAIAGCGGGGGDSTPASTPTAPTPPAIVSVASVSFVPAAAALLVNGTQQLTVVLKDAQGNVLTGRTVTWSSASTAVATVGLAGLVTAVAPGTAQIAAISEGVTATTPITVFSPTAIPVFEKPFAGEYAVGNFMDHNVPLEFSNLNTVFVTFWGETHTNNGGMVDGHSGYDFPMAEGTPILAVAAGTVAFARASAPFFCGGSNSTVSGQLDVVVEHTLPGGIVIRSWYAHLSRIDAAEGQQMVTGQQIGLSGNTGCSAAPHLHFEVRRLTQTRNGQPSSIDPWGWTGAGTDPWDVAATGAQSIQLWKPGKAPQLWRQASPGLPTTASAKLVITKVVYQGVDDASNPNNEYVEITLDTRLGASQVLDGYRLKGDKSLLNFALPAGLTLTVANPSLRIYTGVGTNSVGAIYMGRSAGVWSNLKDDCARLLTPAGAQSTGSVGGACPLPGP